MKSDNSVPWPAYFVAFEHLCAYFELPDWSSVTLTGNDRQNFLNSFCTNDVKRLAPGTCCEAFFCNVKGKVIGHGLVTCRENQFVVIGPPRQGAALAAHLDRYVIREDVQVRDTTAVRSYVLLAGGGEARGMADALAPSAEIGNTWQRPLINAVGMLVDIPVQWIRWDLLGRIFCGFVEVPSHDVSRVRHNLDERYAEFRDRDIFHALRIEAGTPLFGIDFDDHNFPQEVGRNAQAISFTKGCYLGQETVARIDALGHVNQQIVGVAFSGVEVPTVGTPLTHHGSDVGRVTSATFSPGLQRPLALAMVRREHNAVGSQLQSPIGVCEVVPLPP